MARKLKSDQTLFVATLLLEHIDWRRGVEKFAGLRPRSCGIILQENPPGMAAAVTPGRYVPPSIARAVETGHPTLLAKEEVILAMKARGYSRCAQADRDAVFTTEANEAGSVILRWEIGGRLLPGEGGVLRFQAKVR